MSYHRTFGLLLILCSLLYLVGCETTVEPFIGEERPFTVWGLINAGADTQRVRVFPISDAPGIDRSGAIDASVTSTNLTTGQIREWSHRTVTYEDGNVGHVFWAPFKPEEGHSYRIDVARSDGATSTATVTVPAGVEVEVVATSTSTRFPVYVRGDAENLIDVEMRYEAANLPPVEAWPVGTSAHPPVAYPVEIPYMTEGERIDDGWRFDIDMQRDAEIVRLAYQQNCLITPTAPDIALSRVEFHFIAADSAWSPPGGAFDPEVLVEPNAFSNVENGYGFIGAGQVVAERWTPPPLVRQALGYSDSRPCQNGPSPSCANPPEPCIGQHPADIWDIYF